MNNIHKFDCRFTCEIENTENLTDSTILTTTNQESSIINAESSSTNSDPAIILKKSHTQKNSKRQMGATAQILQSCQTNIKELTDHKRQR